uniref:Uncharacterized protein n=1 Tax=Glossina brevipalpis TaxID=37001 RepID=A0A1A9X1X2_9MUSC
MFVYSFWTNFSVIIGQVDAYLNLSHATTTPHHHTAAKINDLMNPALPPKLHKSLTNLKSSTLATSTPHHAGSGTVRNMNKTSEIIKVNNGQLLRNNNINNSINTHTTLTSTTSSTSSVSPSSSNLGSPQTSSNNLSTTSVQTIYTLSKPSTTAALTTLNGVSTVAHVRNRDHDHLNLKIQPPILTLPSSSSATMTSTTSGGTNTGGTKINSSTFYPLQNNVTYTLPKNIAGKMSLNSTINSVVSKVPSVISLPPTASSNNNQENAANTVVGSNCNESSSAAITTSVKSTTLPKILRSKKDFLHSNTAVNSNSSSASNNYTTIASSTACAISQCNMPPYPKLFNTFNNSNSLISTVSNSSSSFSPSQTTTTTTNVAVVTTTQQCINMQTQTITSTLAGNLYVDDFFTSSSPTSNSSGNCKQTALPAACTTSKNYLNPKEHFLPNDASLDDDYLSECENCKIAQSTKYYLDTAALLSTPQETMTLQRKSLEENKEEPETGYYRISHTLPSNSKKNTPLKSINNREPWFSTIPAASSSSDEDINE